MQWKQDASNPQALKICSGKKQLGSVEVEPHEI
jgi:hypothetical protein